MVTVAAILRQKGNAVATIGPDTTVADLTATLSQKRIGAVLVVDGDGILGILSERDIVHSLASNGARTLDMTAAELMTREVQTASPATTVAEAMAMMTAGRFRHVPVVEHGRLAGIISIGDVVKARLEQQEHEVDSLKAYVAGAA